MNSFELDETLTSKEKLLEVGVYLFARYGYEGTSTRMIAEAAKLNISAMNFYFNSKENFYHCVISYVAEEISLVYADFYNKITELKECPKLEKETIWNLICELIDLQLNIAFDRNQSDFFLLLCREQLYDLDDLPLTHVIFEKAENSLTFLLSNYYDTMPMEKVIVISRLINSALVSFGDHAAFFSSSPVSKSLKKVFIKETTRDFIFKSIESYTFEKTK